VLVEQLAPLVTAHDSESGMATSAACLPFWCTLGHARLCSMTLDA
jgi:hypothetical protein